jgi:hypothetical protein
VIAIEMVSRMLGRTFLYVHQVAAAKLSRANAPSSMAEVVGSGPKSATAWVGHDLPAGSCLRAPQAKKTPSRPRRISRQFG